MWCSSRRDCAMFAEHAYEWYVLMLPVVACLWRNACLCKFILVDMSEVNKLWNCQVNRGSATREFVDDIASATAMTSRPIWLQIHAHNRLQRRPHLNQLQQQQQRQQNQRSMNRFVRSVTSRVTSPACKRDGCFRATKTDHLLHHSQNSYEATV